jgi:hypothetical protein
VTPEAGEGRTFVIGSHQVLDQQDENEVSYRAPLARPPFGRRRGRGAKGHIGDETTVYRVVRIE